MNSGYCSPNQRYFKGGSTILGDRYRSGDLVRNQLVLPDRRIRVYDRLRRYPFTGIPVDADGTCRLKGLPIGPRQTIAFVHGSHRLARTTASGRSDVRFTLHSPAPVRLQVTVVPQGYDAE